MTKGFRMSNAGHFNSKHCDLTKHTRKEIKTFEDFPSRLLRHADGSQAMYRGGKMVPGTHVTESKLVAKVDVPTVESKFYKETPVSTIIEKPRGDEKKEAGEKEPAAGVRKPLDVNARALK